MFENKNFKVHAEAQRKVLKEGFPPQETFQDRGAEKTISLYI
jgi:hypothetical protein